MRNQPQGRAASREIGRPVTQHDRMQVDAIFVEQAQRREACRQLRAGNFNVAPALCLSAGIASPRLPLTSEAFGPTASSVRETTHLCYLRQAVANASSASPEGDGSRFWPAT